MLELDFPVIDQGYTSRQFLRHEASLQDYVTIPPPIDIQAFRPGA